MLSRFWLGVARFDLRHANTADKSVRSGEVQPLRTDEMQEYMQCKTKPTIWH
jgi:hypothetical protein